MLNAIKAYFANNIFKDPETGPTDQELHLATAALLLEVSHADFEISDEELSVMAELLKKQFKFSDTETQTLLKLALEEHADKHSLHPFVQLINANFSIQAKRLIIENMWKVAYADRRLDKYEEYRIRKIADLIHVPHRDFIQTKLKVQERLKGA